MTVFLIRRLLQTLAVLFAVSLVVFVGLYAVGSPAEILLPDDATEVERQAAIMALGWWVNGPLVEAAF